MKSTDEAVAKAKERIRQRKLATERIKVSEQRPDKETVTNGTRFRTHKETILDVLDDNEKVVHQLDSNSPKTDRRHKETKIPVRLLEIHIGTTCSGQTQTEND